MKLKEKLEIRNFESSWKDYDRKDLFTWVHRYLRLNNQLLKDSVYQNMYDYLRKSLMAYLREDIKELKVDDEKLGELVDVFADVFNKESAEQVNKYKSVVEELYSVWEKYPETLNEIQI